MEGDARCALIGICVFAFNFAIHFPVIPRDQVQFEGQLGKEMYACSLNLPEIVLNPMFSHNQNAMTTPGDVVIKQNVEGCYIIGDWASSW